MKKTGQDDKLLRFDTYGGNLANFGLISVL